jgi:prephenate dehydrogenase
MMIFKHIAIVGVGLIGGSFALAVRRAGVCERVTGWDRKDVLDRALARGVIDGMETAFESGEVSEADLVYLATPVGSILSFLRTRSNSLKPGAMVTDAGSTKRDICRVAREALPREVSFIGGHPMAGSERTGVEFADADLFQGAAYALVAVDGARPDAVRTLTETVKSIGARPVALKAEQHDRVAARISHSPQLISTALALAVARTNDTDALSLGGSGLVEMTRLAESRWSVWEDICRTNSDEITSALDDAIGQMEAIRIAISSGDFSGVGDMFSAAGEVTRRLRESKRGGA